MLPAGGQQRWIIGIFALQQLPSGKWGAEEGCYICQSIPDAKHEVMHCHIWSSNKINFKTFLRAPVGSPFTSKFAFCICDKTSNTQTPPRDAKADLGLNLEVKGLLLPPGFTISGNGTRHPVVRPPKTRVLLGFFSSTVTSNPSASPSGFHSELYPKPVLLS